MESLGWYSLLFGAKWVLIGLIYFALFTVLNGVRREMALRVGTEAGPASLAPGRLRVVQPGSDPRLQAGAWLTLRPETSLGSEKSNDLPLGDRFISRRHASLRWDGISWWLEDLGSRNGTYLNGVRLPPNAAQRVQPGAVIQMGEIALELVE